MQFSKDTFYATLRDRLAQLNPARVITINGAQRPAVLVAENAPATDAPALLDCFILSWTAPAIVQAIAPDQALWRIECRIAYSTSGTDAASTDRGRTLAALDNELATISFPRNAAKRNYTTAPPTELGTNIFWSEPRFADAAPTGQTLTRDASFTVFFFSEVTA
jgi:hypothetical protein